jgi:hypothetical protein
MKATAIALGLLLGLSTSVVFAQTTDDVQILVSGFALATNGAEKPSGVSLRTSPTTTGKTSSGLFSMFGCGNFSVRYPPAAIRFDDNTTAGWIVEITPIRIVDHAVTFRLHWVHADSGKGLSPTGEDLELTLKPGESRPIDTVPVPAAATALNGRPCTMKAASLRVSAEFPDFDSRLIGADVWLVERLPNGTERSQLQSLRGLPHQSIPFYLERIADVDMFGHLVAEPEQAGLGVFLEIVRAQVDIPPPADTHGYQAAHWDRSTVHVKPDEVVEVPLPQLEERFGPYAKRNFALRIRARQIR